MKQKQLLCENWKSLVYWQSKLTFCYKKNVLTEELRRTKKKKLPHILSLMSIEQIN